MEAPKFIWDEILRDSSTLQRDEYKSLLKPFNYEHLIERYKPSMEEYWLLQAATDLDPYKQEMVSDNTETNSNSISIPTSENSDVQEILHRWEKLNSARNILIIDQYANRFYSIKTLDALLKMKTVAPLKVTIISTSDDKPREEWQKKIIDTFEKNFNVNFIFKEKFEMPHDRYWILDEESFTIGTSPNSIWIKKNNRAIIKEQLNINPISNGCLPKEVDEWRNEYV